MKRHCMRRVALAVVGASLLAAPAAAGDSSWTGFYIGGHGGYGWADWDGRIATTAGCTGTCPDFDPASPPAGYTTGLVDSHRTLSADGWLGGGQLGFNWQSGAWVLGLEADISAGDLKATDTSATDPRYNNSIWSKKTDLTLDTFGTLRARLGYANGSIMPYVTGGLAWGSTTGNIAATYTPNGYTNPSAVAAGTSYASVDQSHVGWTAGAGVEWKLAGSWSLKAEYLYVDLGEQDYLFKGKVFNGATFDTDSFPSDLTFQTVRLGLNYKLF